MHHATIRLHNEFDRRWRPALMAFFLRRIGDRNEAEDLTQEVFVRMLSQDHSEAVRDAYVFQIASNLIIDRGRRLKVRSDFKIASTVANDSSVDLIDPLRAVISKEELNRVLDVLQSVSERQRDIFMLYNYEGLLQAEIAEKFDISVSAVKKNVAKTLALIAVSLSDELA